MPQLDLYRACDEIFLAVFLFLVIYLCIIFIIIPIIIKRKGIIQIKKKQQKYKKLNLAIYTTLNKFAKIKTKYIIKV